MDAPAAERKLREWWGGQGQIRHRPGGWIEVGLRVKGGFRLYGRGRTVEEAMRKAEARLRLPPPRVAVPEPLGSRRRTLKRAGQRKPQRARPEEDGPGKPPNPHGIHHGMNARDALALVPLLGGTAEGLNRTGEVIIRFPGLVSVRVQHPTRRKDASRELTGLLLRATRQGT